MAWYTKYMKQEEDEIKKRQKAFEQEMRELKERDKYGQKMARKERVRTRKGVSLMHLRRKKAARQSRARGPKPEPYYQRSPVGGGNRSKLYTWDGKPIRHSQVGMSGAPQFASLASAGYKSPGQLGFKTYTGRPQGHRYTPPGASGRGGQRWIEERKEGRQAPRAWSERQGSLGRPSDYGTYLADRRLRMSTGLKDPMGSAISAGQGAAGVVGQGIGRIDPNNPGNIFRGAGQWLGGLGLAPGSRPTPSFPGAQVPGGQVPGGQMPVGPGAMNTRPTPSFPGASVPGGQMPVGPGAMNTRPRPEPPSTFYPDASKAPAPLPWEYGTELPPGSTYDDVRPSVDPFGGGTPDPVMPWLRENWEWLSGMANPTAQIERILRGGGG